MKIKFTGLYEKIDIILIEHRFYHTFTRNLWVDIPDKIASILTKDEHFLTEEDIIFNPEILKKSNLRLALNRFGALGDLIMLLPVARYLKQTTNCTIDLITQSQYTPFLCREHDAFDNVLPTSLYKKNSYDKTVYLDGVLEQDHSVVNPDRLLHRTKLYERFFGIEIKEYDFSMHVTEEEYKYAEEILNASY